MEIESLAVAMQLVLSPRCGPSTAGRGTGFRGTLTRVSAAVAVARAVVPNFIDDGVGAFEHEARASAGLSLLFVAGR